MFFWEINFIFMQIFFDCFLPPTWRPQTHSIVLSALTVLNAEKSHNERSGTDKAVTIYVRTMLSVSTKAHKRNQSSFDFYQFS